MPRTKPRVEANSTNGVAMAKAKAAAHSRSVLTGSVCGEAGQCAMGVHATGEARVATAAADAAAAQRFGLLRAKTLPSNLSGLADRKYTKVTHIGRENPLFSVEADFTRRRTGEGAKAQQTMERAGRVAERRPEKAGTRNPICIQQNESAERVSRGRRSVLIQSMRRASPKPVLPGAFDSDHFRVRKIG